MYIAFFQFFAMGGLFQYTEFFIFYSGTSLNFSTLVPPKYNGFFQFQTRDFKGDFLTWRAGTVEPL